MVRGGRQATEDVRMLRFELSERPEWVIIYTTKGIERAELASPRNARR